MAAKKVKKKSAKPSNMQLVEALRRSRKTVKNYEETVSIILENFNKRLGKLEGKTAEDMKKRT